MRAISVHAVRCILLLTLIPMGACGSTPGESIARPGDGDANRDTRDAATDESGAPDMDETDAAICPAPDCDTSPCAWGVLTGPDGCELCACAPPPLGFRRADHDHEERYLSFEASVEPYVGALCRHIVTAQWRFDIPEAADDEEVVDVEIAGIDFGLTLDDEPRTFWYPPRGEEPVGGGNGLEPRGATHTLFGAFVSETDLRLTEGWVTLRRTERGYEGGTWLLFDSDEDFPGQVEVSGSFAPSD